MMFLRCQTQWNTTFGGVVGLKYEVLLLDGGLFDLYHVITAKKCLKALQLMESVAMKELIRRRSSGSSTSSYP